MPRVVKYNFHIVIQRDELIVEDRLNKAQRRFRVADRVKRFYRRLPGSGISSGLPLRVLFVNIRAVLEHDVQKIRRRISAVNRAFKTALHQQRQPAAVVDMRVTEYHAFNLSRVKRERFLIHFFGFPAALKLSAVKQDLMLVRRNQVAGSRYAN